MPALGKISERGVCIPLVSTFPATTPVAWAAMSTGCYPSTNGIEGFLLHRPGRAFDDRISGVYANQLNAEPLWQTASLNGLASFVVKFPVSYPSNAATLRIDGAAGWGGLTCLHEVAASGTSAWSENDASAQKKQHQRGAVINKGPNWSGKPPPEFTPRWFGTVALCNIWGHAPVEFNLAISVRGRAHEPILSIACASNWNSVDAKLAEGSWSDPIVVNGANRRGEPCPCAVRFKLLVLNSDPVRLRLFNTPVHELSGHTNADARWQRHLCTAGPIEEQTDPTPLFSGAIDMSTHIERCRLNTDWLRRVSRSILEHERWDLFMVQTHIIDWAHHILHGAVDPRHPLHDPTRADEADSLLRRFYAMADELVAGVVEAAGGDANVIVMGDHGQDLHHTTVRFNAWLAELGHLKFAERGGGAIDWPHTRACVLGNGLYVNLSGRDPQGIVDRADYYGLIDELSRGLRTITDPRTGEPVVHIAGPRTDFTHIGGHGRGTGDIVFALRSGYQARNNQGPMFEITKPMQEFTSGHDHFWPFDPRLETRMFGAGPAFLAQAQPTRLRSIVDIAPTITAILSIDPPAGIDGASISDILAGRAAGVSFETLEV